MQFEYVTDVFEQTSFALHDYNVDKRSIMVCAMCNLCIYFPCDTVNDLCLTNL